MLEAEAKALTHFSLEAEAEALVMKPGYLYCTKSNQEAEAEAEAFGNHEAEARLSKI